MLKAISFAFSMAFAATVAQAQDRTLACEVDLGGTQGWVSKQLVFFQKAGGDEALVNDALIAHLIKRPLVAKVVAENDKRVTYKWELPFMRDQQGQVVPRFLYRASYYKQTGKFSLSATPAGYANNFQAYGTCKLK